MRIDGTITAGNAEWGSSSPGYSRAGALIPLSPGESRKGSGAPSQHISAGEYVIVHDEARGAVVIDLYLAALRFDEPPAYRLTGRGAVEIGRKARKGSIVDLRT